MGAPLRVGFWGFSVQGLRPQKLKKTLNLESCLPYSSTPEGSSGLGFRGLGA